MIEIKIPVPTEGLSPGDLRRFQTLIHGVLVGIADKLEEANDWDWDASARHALASGFRGDPELRRDA